MADSTTSSSQVDRQTPSMPLPSIESLVIAKSLNYNLPIKLNAKKEVKVAVKDREEEDGPHGVARVL
ncbi:hypothetical protein ACOSP7_017134 [Xanthoceras sorbifolium]